MNKLRPKVYVIEFNGDVQASQVSELRDKISLILLVCGRFDQVVVVLESPGGMVSEYGLVASQLLRLKNMDFILQFVLILLLHLVDIWQHV